MAALAGLGFGLSVQAQSAAQEESSAGESSTSMVIEEIVVTSQKRQQALEDVPIVVSVLNSDFIQDAGIVGLEDVRNYIPSLLLERNTNPFATTIRIRGVGNLGNIPNFEPRQRRHRDYSAALRPLACHLDFLRATAVSCHT